MAFAKPRRALTPAPANEGRFPYPVAPGRQHQPYRDNWDLTRAVEQGFNRSVWVFRAINAIATNQAKLPMRTRAEDWFAGKIIDNGATSSTMLTCLNHKSNPYEHAAMFRKRISQIVMLNRQGCMVEVVKDRVGRPIALYILPPGYTFPVPDERTFISSFRVQYPGKAWVDVDPANVLWFREPHPTDPYGGITPLEAAGLNVEMDYFARLYNRNFLANDMRPGGVLVVKGDMSDPDKEELRRRFSGYGPGYAGAGRLTAISSDDGADFVDTATQPRDGHYTSLEKMTREAILLAFGVPESILGNASGRTFANADAERDIFWQETMLPHLDMIARGFDDIVDPDPARFCSFDWTMVPILERAKRERHEYLLKEVQAEVIAADEYREATGRERVGASKLHVQAGKNPTADVDKPYTDPNAVPAPPVDPNAAPPATGPSPAPAEAAPATDPTAESTPDWFESLITTLDDPNTAKTLDPLPVVFAARPAPFLDAPRDDLWSLTTIG